MLAFPVTNDKPDGRVETPQLVSESILLLLRGRKRSGVYAIDCTMVRRHFSLRALLKLAQFLTEDGKELTCVCIIDYESGIVVYDKLVKPPKPVIDYLTR